MRRRDVGRANVGAGSTARDGLVWWRHHVSEARAGFHEASLHGGNSSLMSSSMLTFAPPGVGVVVYP